MVICETRVLLSILCLLLACGCTGTSTSDRLEVRPSAVAERGEPRYTVLTAPPDAVLDRMKSDYLSDNEVYPRDYKDFRRRWNEEASASPLNGQRAIELLEVACYADVTCHGIEYPLRVATLGYIEANIHTADVEDALRWIQSSYKSGLPLEAPRDKAGQFRGLLVESMGLRMAEYADELLKTQTLSQNRK